MEFYSNGKLLITGEYLVLDGALAFALPTKFGQSLRVFPLQSPVISWKSYDSDQSIWYNDELLITDIISKNTNSSQDKFRKTLIAILHQAHLQNPQILNSQKGFLVETILTFPRNWGLGTSSTLINNIAQWFQIDAFELLQKSFGGSGYDIACAQNETPIYYQLVGDKPQVTPVAFNPSYSNQIYFVYLNQKQDSKVAIANFRMNTENLSEYKKQISVISTEIVKAETQTDFIELLRKHENLLSDVLKIQTIQQQYFPDFDGVVKSLGGWGGDFVMVVSQNDPCHYFKSKGYETILSYREMIK